MTHAHRSSLRAATAICAALALGSTPVWAQEVAPTVSAPSAAPQITLPPPAAAQPTIQWPTSPSAPAAPQMISEPLVQPAPQQSMVTPEAVAPGAATNEATPRQTATRTATRSAPARIAAEASAPGAAAAPAAIAPSAPVAAAPQAVPAATVAAPAPAVADGGAAADNRGEGFTGSAIVALLAALGVTGAGIALLRSRRRRADDEHLEEAYDAAYVPPARAEAVAPLPAYASVAEVDGAPLVLRDQALERDRAQTRAAIGSEELAPVTERRADHTVGDRAAPGAGPVPSSREERDALLHQMVSAAPDAENPFTSRKARLRRARIILQSREIDAKDEATKPFDWRTYKSVASNPTPATPPRVMA